MSLKKSKSDEGQERRPSLRSNSSNSLKRSRSRSRSKRRKRAASSNDLIACLDNVQEPDGYRSDTSDNGDEVNIEEDQEKEIVASTSPRHVKPDGDYSVSRLKRSLSGKLRGGSKVSEITVDDSLSKLVHQGLSPKQFVKQVKRGSLEMKENGDKQTLLHLCASRGHKEYIRSLIKRGADVNLQDKQGYTPLLCAATAKNLNCCYALLESKDIDVTITNLQDSNCLHYLVRIPIDENNIVLYRKVLDALIDKGLDVNQQNRNLETPMHSACINGLNIRAVAFLIERGADCNLSTKSGETALHYAVHNCSTTLVRLLMEYGADPTVKTGEESCGDTVVDIAETYHFTDILESLQSIIEEELIVEDGSNTFNSMRARINEATIIKEGYLDVMWQQDWDHLFVRLNSHRIVCFKKKGDLKPVCQVRLANTEVTSEQELNGNTLSFASKNPEESEDWLDGIEDIIEERSDLFDMYERLKVHSKTRKNLRIKERSIAVDACVDGCKALMAIGHPEQLCKYFLENPSQTAAALCSATHNEKAKIYQDFVNYLTHKNHFVTFMKEAFTHEIRTTAIGETLFREMSFCTRMFAAYLETDPGREYLRKCVTPLLEDIASTTTNDNDSNSPRGDGSPCFQVNFTKIIRVSERFLNHVVTSSADCPLEFRELMSHLSSQVKKFFPNMTHAVVGGFVFLRYLCPGIITPRTIGPKISDKQRREAVLITKLLQTVSNGAEFDGTKEDYMKQFNPFVNKNRLLFSFYFENLTNLDSIAKQRGLEKRKRLSKSGLDSVEQRLFEWIQSLYGRMESLCTIPDKICVSFDDSDGDDFHDRPDVCLDA